MRSGIRGGRFFFVTGFAAALVQACGGESTGPIGGAGGATGKGGSSSGGTASGSGGAPATGGSKAGSGGISSGGVTGGGGATGGTIGAGGKTTGGSVGKSTGGTPGTGGKATGGTPGTGGKATSSSCQVDSVDNACLKCVKTGCCQEWLDCGDDEHCSQTPSNDGEVLCIQNCVIDVLNETGAVPDLTECAGACQHQSSGVSVATSELIGCMRSEGEDGLQLCTTQCFGAEL